VVRVPFVFLRVNSVSVTFFVAQRSNNRQVTSFVEEDFRFRAAQRLRLVPGMQVSAEIHLGTRSVLEYLLSPVQKVAHQAGRER
jgi:hypothetical protein